MYIPDALSRLQVRIQAVRSTIDNDEMYAYVGSVVSSLPASDTRLQQIMEAQEEDPVCRQIKVYCYKGWLDKHSLNDAMKPYWSSRGELSVVQNILLKASRILIPSSMRLEILDKIHEGHQGITECREWAKSSVWWPGLSREIHDLVQQCRVCALHRDNKPELLITRPFNKTTKIIEKATRVGLKINKGKTKVMRINGKSQKKVAVDGQDIDEVE
ncbi:hypothetical protein ACROYT_G000980 [Oculina patagonica]